MSHWPHWGLFVTTRAVFGSTETEPGSEPGSWGEKRMISRRTAICLTAVGLSAIASIGSAQAADYPTRPVRWVVGYPPGGATDIIARLIGQRLSEKLGQQFVIENKPGAGNNIATEAVVNAAARRLHRAAGQSGELHQHDALRQSEVQFRQRHRADRVLQSRAERDDGQQGRDRRKTSPSSSPMRKPIRAR